MFVIKSVGCGLVMIRLVLSTNKNDLDLLLILICYFCYVINIKQEWQGFKYWTVQHTILYYSPTGARFIVIIY
jgi:hypothetical protein